MRPGSLQNLPHPADSPAMESIRTQVPAEEAASAEPLVAIEPKKQSRKVILAMLLTLCFGLLLASVYLGGRISSTHAAAKHHSTARAVALTKPRPVSSQPKELAASPAAPLPAAAQSAAPGKIAGAKKEESPTAAPLAITPPVPAKPARNLAPAVVKTAPVIVAVAKTPMIVAEAAALPAAAKLPLVPPVAAESQAARELVHPQPGAAYIQVGAFAQPYVGGWVSVLEGRGFHPIVADGPNDVIRRVLIGPLAPSQVTEVEAKLRQAGIEHFEKVY